MDFEDGHGTRSSQCNHPNIFTNFYLPTPQTNMEPYRRCFVEKNDVRGQLI